MKGKTIHLQGSKKARGKHGQFFCQISAVRAAEKGGSLSKGEKARSGTNVAYLKGLSGYFIGLRKFL